MWLFFFWKFHSYIITFHTNSMKHMPIWHILFKWSFMLNKYTLRSSVLIVFLRTARQFHADPSVYISFSKCSHLLLCCLIMSVHVSLALAFQDDFFFFLTFQICSFKHFFFHFRENTTLLEFFFSTMYYGIIRANLT